MEMKDFLILAFMTMFVTLGLMNVGIDLATNNKVTLSQDSQDYLSNTFSTAVDANFNVSKFKSDVKNINVNSSNITTNTNPNSYSFSYMEDLKNTNKVLFILDTVFNIPTFIILSLGFNITDYSIYINIITMFLIILGAIAMYLFLKGRV